MGRRGTAKASGSQKERSVEREWGLGIRASGGQLAGSDCSRGGPVPGSAPSQAVEGRDNPKVLLHGLQETSQEPWCPPHRSLGTGQGSGWVSGQEAALGRSSLTAAVGPACTGRAPGLLFQQHQDCPVAQPGPWHHPLGSRSDAWRQREGGRDKRSGCLDASEEHMGQRPWACEWWGHQGRPP